MNEKQALKILLNLIQEHREIYDVKLPDFLNEEFIDSDANSAGELLSQILKQEVENAKEEDGEADIRELLPDILAYYRSFRFRAPDRFKAFGIHLNLPAFARFCKKIKWITKANSEDVITAAWKFIFTHEANHFDCDLGSLIVENGLDNTFRAGRYKDFRFHCNHEEALGQTRGKLAVKKMKYIIIAEAIESMFKGASAGYDNFDFYTKALHFGFDEVVSHSVMQLCDKHKPAFLAHVIMNRKDYSHKILKIYFHFRLENFNENHKLAVPKNVNFDEKAEKQLNKILKKDKLFEELVEKAKAQLLADPHHPSLRVSKFNGVEGIYEARLDRGSRILFKKNESGGFTILEIGKELYRH